MDVTVSGFGIICAIGNDAASVLRSLQEGRTGIGPMRYLQSSHKELPVGEVKLSNEEMKRMLGQDEKTIISRTVLMGAIAIRQALEHAKLDLKGKRVALINGTTVGGMDITERYFKQTKEDDALLPIIEKHDCGSSTREMADLAGLKDAEVCTISTACSSAVNAIILGSEMLLNNEADIIIAGDHPDAPLRRIRYRAGGKRRNPEKPQNHRFHRKNGGGKTKGKEERLKHRVLRSQTLHVIFAIITRYVCNHYTLCLATSHVMFFHDLAFHSKVIKAKSSGKNIFLSWIGL